MAYICASIISGYFVFTTVSKERSALAGQSTC